MINKDVFGLVYASEDNYNLRDLVTNRSLAALPVGGRYRAIDFILSNLVNSGIRNVGVITRTNYKSLMDHLGSGREWDLARKNNGLFILPPFDTSANTGIYQGMCDAVYGKLDYVRSAPQQYCLLTGSYTIFSTSFDQMFAEHIESGADITLLYSTEGSEPDDSRHFKDVRLYTDENGRVVDMEYNPAFTKSNKLGMDVYLMRKSLLENLVQAACARGKYSFIVDVLIPNLRNLNVHAVSHKGYVGRLTSLGAYFGINMDMLKENVQKDLFYSDGPVYTKIKDEAPVRYMDSVNVKNCILGDGCEIDGTLENCVIFRGVKIGKDANLRGCIIMQGTEVQDECVLQNAIVDKYCSIRRGIRLVGAEDFPVVIRKGAII